MFFPDWLRVSRRSVFCSVRDSTDSGNTTSCCRYITPLVCFVLCKCNPCNGSFVKSSECDSACRYAGWGAVALTAGRFGFACTFSEGKKKLLLRAHKTRAGTHTHTHTHTSSHTHTHPQTHIHILSMAINHMRNVHAIICIYIHTRCN